MTKYSNDFKDILDKIYFYEITHRNDLKFPINRKLQKESINLPHNIIDECVNRCIKKYLCENIVKTPLGVKYLYHATPSCYVSSIMKYGLGGKLPQTRFWEYEGTPYENITKGCFLATDEYVAESYVETSEAFEELADMYKEQYGKELEIVVFRVNIDDLDQNLLSIDTNQMTDDDTDPTFFYDGVIPYNQLEQIRLY